MKKTWLLGVTPFLAVVAVILGFHFFSAPSGEKTKAAKTSGTVTQVAKELSPSIVGITSYGQQGDFFSQKTVQKTGSGVAVDEDGFIVTNNHVVEDAEQIAVVLADGKKTKAKLVGTDRRTDLALLKVEGVRLKPARLGDSDRLEVGETVVAIGNPMGLRFARSVTAGVISGLNRLLITEEGFVFRLIQTDAAINPGNSGGALANLAREVIGINTVKIAVPGFEGMGFAIPSNQVKEVLASLRVHGRVVRPVAGLKLVREVTGEEADFYRLPVKFGVAVVPQPNGPAHKAGVKKYDIVQEVNGHKVRTVQELQECIMRCRVGDEVELKLVRLPRQQGETLKTLNVKVKLGKDG